MKKEIYGDNIYPSWERWYCLDVAQGKDGNGKHLGNSRNTTHIYISHSQQMWMNSSTKTPWIL